MGRVILDQGAVLETLRDFKGCEVTVEFSRFPYFFVQSGVMDLFPASGRPELVKVAKPDQSEFAKFIPERIVGVRLADDGHPTYIVG